jgi:hypothetical protein
LKRNKHENFIHKGGHNMKFITILFTLFAAGQLSAVERPTDPWILRGVMREKPRMIFMALHENLSVVYEALNCGLYMAWAGGMEDGNELYNHQTGGNRGSTFYPQGVILHKQSDEGQISENDPYDNREKSFSPPNEPAVPVWSVQNQGQNVEAEVDYRGYTVDNSALTAKMRYRITLYHGRRKFRDCPGIQHQRDSPGHVSGVKTEWRLHPEVRRAAAPGGLVR